MQNSKHGTCESMNSANSSSLIERILSPFVTLLPPLLLYPSTLCNCPLHNIDYWKYNSNSNYYHTGRGNTYFLFSPTQLGISHVSALTLLLYPSTSLLKLKQSFMAFRTPCIFTPIFPLTILIHGCIICFFAIKTHDVLAYSFERLLYVVFFASAIRTTLHLLTPNPIPQSPCNFLRALFVLLAVFDMQGFCKILLFQLSRKVLLLVVAPFLSQEGFHLCIVRIPKCHTLSNPAHCSAIALAIPGYVLLLNFAVCGLFQAKTLPRSS